MSSERQPSLRWLWWLKLSPLLPLVLLLALALSVPPLIGIELLESTASGPWPNQEARAMWVDIERFDTVSKAAGLQWGVGGGSLDEAAQESWERWASRTAGRLTRADVLDPKPGEGVFKPVEEWAGRNNAQIWAWQVLAASEPALVASAVVDVAPLNALRRSTPNSEVMLSEEETAGSLWRLLNHDYDSSQGAMPPLRPEMFTPGAGGGSGSMDHYVGESSIRRGGQWWRVYSLSAPTDMQTVGDSDPLGVLPETLPSDPRFQTEIARIARRTKTNVFVFGPLDSPAMPVRVPPGETTATAQELSEAAWPSLASGSVFGALPLRLSRDQSMLAGGEAGVIELGASTGSNHFAGMTFRPDEIAPQTLAFLAVYERMPGGEPAANEEMWRSWQRFISAWYPYLVGVAFALLALSLVASPAAFVYERRVIARHKAQEELASMRRDAHDRVYNRLSALSKRVAATADEAADAAASSLTIIADDIRGTVGELQEILGEDARHTNVALTTLSLAEQLGAVCEAQAARLGVEVECRVDQSIPELSPDLGWDLQCIADEAITNAAKHGCATRVIVTVSVGGDSLVLAISDNGAGSNVTSLEDVPDGSTGLLGIGGRAAKRGGELAIESGADGTTVSVTIPLA